MDSPVAYGKPLPLTVAGAVEDQVPIQVHPTPFPFEPLILTHRRGTLPDHLPARRRFGQDGKRQIRALRDIPKISARNAGDRLQPQIAERAGIGQVAVRRIKI